MCFETDKFLNFVLTITIQLLNIFIPEIVQKITVCAFFAGFKPFTFWGKTVWELIITRTTTAPHQNFSHRNTFLWVAVFLDVEMSIPEHSNQKKIPVP